MHRKDQFKYELAPYFYLLVGGYVVMTANPMGKAFAAVLMLLALWIILIRMYHRGVFGARTTVGAGAAKANANRRNVAVRARLTSSPNPVQPAWTYSAGLDGYTVEE